MFSNLVNKFMPKKQPQRSCKTFTIDLNSQKSVAVITQRKFVGHHAIPSSLAATPCASLGTAQLLETLNEVLGTEHTTQDPILSDLLSMCIGRGYDFGMTYAFLRPRWTWPSSEAKTDLEECEIRDQELREQAVDEYNQIVNPGVPPRRVWDLYSNRVVPYWVAATRGQLQITPVSHAWVKVDSRHNVETEINSYEWCVPTPTDTTLEHIRVELLNFGIEYAWLDVACLRQADCTQQHQNLRAEKDKLRQEEWRLDVPTIGNVYQSTNATIYYLNGLGRPQGPADLTDERHWLNRAWTLQETTINSPLMAGRTESPVTAIRHMWYNKLMLKFGQIAFTLVGEEDFMSIFQIVNLMQPRAASSELDKITGLAYLLKSDILPAYVSGQDPEDAWSRLVETMSPQRRTELLFSFPAPGEAAQSWHPSWKQLMQTKVRSSWFFFFGGEELQYDRTNNFYFHDAFCINCFIERLDGQQWRVTFPAIVGQTYTTSVPKDVSLEVPTGDYILIGNKTFKFWVVGQEVKVGDSKRIKKISAFEPSFFRLGVMVSVGVMASLQRIEYV